MNHLQSYLTFLKQFLRPMRPLKIVIDCSDGVAGEILKKLFTEDGNPEVILINAEPNPDFPAHGPNPLVRGAMREIAEAVKQEQADFGAIFDADGDRVFFVDNHGGEVPADAVSRIMSGEIKTPILVTPNAGYLMRDWHEVREGRIGHAFMKQTLREQNLDFGYESSGHYYFKDFFSCDSGIVALLKFLSAISSTTSPLRKTVKSFGVVYRLQEKNFHLKNSELVAKKLVQIEATYTGKSKISRTEDLRVAGDDWWFSLHPSHTEPLLRLNLEAKDKKVFQQKKAEILSLIKSA